MRRRRSGPPDQAPALAMTAHGPGEMAAGGKQVGRALDDRGFPALPGCSPSLHAEAGLPEPPRTGQPPQKEGGPGGTGTASPPRGRERAVSQAEGTTGGPGSGARAPAPPQLPRAPRLPSRRAAAGRRPLPPPATALSSVQPRPERRRRPDPGPVRCAASGVPRGGAAVAAWPCPGLCPRPSARRS